MSKSLVSKVDNGWESYGHEVIWEGFHESLRKSRQESYRTERESKSTIDDKVKVSKVKEQLEIRLEDIISLTTFG